MRGTLLQIIPPTVAMLFATFAAVSDLRTRRIPNRLVLLCLPAALLTQFAASGWTGVLEGTAAAGTAFVFTIGAFLLGGIGAGDVKLVTVMGAFTGLHALALMLITTALTGGIFSLFVITQRTYGERTRHDFKDGAAARTQPVSIPYALPIACGVLAVLCHVLRGLA